MYFSVLQWLKCEQHLHCWEQIGAVLVVFDTIELCSDPIYC